MTSAMLDELYFQWLYRKVAVPEIPDGSMTYWRVLKVLFQKEFKVFVDEDGNCIDHDENRIEDGKALRLRFLEDQGLPVDVDPDWMEIGCSVLELMVGLAVRLEFEADGTIHFWFWKLIQNIGLDGYHDNVRLPRKHIDNVLSDIISRNYQPNGEGGFFPLRNPRADQRKVEIGAQLNAYVLERGAS